MEEKKIQETVSQTVQPSRFKRESPAFRRTDSRPTLTLFGTQFVPVYSRLVIKFRMDVGSTIR